MIKILNFPVVGKFIRDVNYELTNLGWQETSRRLMKRTHTKLLLHNLTPEIASVLKEKSVIIVANHPHDMEVLALIAALPSREDIYVVFNAMFTGLNTEVDKHLIPVYIRHHSYGKSGKTFLNKLLDTYRPQTVDSPEIEHQKNIQSIRKAAEKVRGGGLVIIYPGRRSPDGNWYPGVGHMVREVGKMQDTYIVQVHTEGTSSWDYLRLLPFAGRILPKIHIYFSGPRLIQDFVTDDGKTITHKLQEKYTFWENGVKK